MSKTKAVAYSYPTSPNAERFKLREGGYCVEIVKREGEYVSPPLAVAGFATLEQAKLWASEMLEPWDRLTL